METVGIKLLNFPVERRGKYDFKVARLQVEGKEVVVTLCRLADAPEHMVFSVNAIDMGEKRLWKYEDAKEDGFSGYVRMEEVKGVLLIVYLQFIGGGRSAIHQVIPVIDLMKSLVVKNRKDGGKRRVGGSSKEKLFDLKIATAFALRDLRPEIIYTLEEEEIFERRRKAEEEIRQREEAERAVKVAQERKILDEKRQAIFQRDRITVFDKKGNRHVYGPVVDGEWQILQDKARVILVEGFTADGRVQRPLEVILVKSNGRVEKVIIAADLSFDNPKEQTIEADYLDLLVNGQAEEVLYLTPDQIQRIHDDNLNFEGVLVTSGKVDEHGCFAVSRFKADGELEFVGNCPEVTAE